MAVRSDCTSVREQHEPWRHTPDNPLLRGQPLALVVRQHARVRAWLVRARNQPVTRAHAPVPRDVARDPRVAEPPVGKPRRTGQSGLALLSPRAEEGIPAAFKRGPGNFL